jgi:AraC-like DNA-binding protein
MQRIERFVEQWTKNGSYLKCGLKLPIAAAEIGVPQYQLSGWLKQKNLKYSEWITTLRIEEAKRVLLEYPEWTLEAVAEHCGFNSREYFHRIFRSYLGMPPIKYQQNKGVISE